MTSSAEHPFAAIIAFLAAVAAFLDTQAMLNVGTSHIVRDVATTPAPPRREAPRSGPDAPSFSTRAERGRARPPSPPAQVTTALASSRENNEIRRGIRKYGPHEYSVQRAALDRLLEAQARPMGSTRVVPEQEAGKIVGVRLFGIGNDTLLGILGFQNGDRLQRINSYDITSPDHALEAYAHLRTANLLVVEVNRRGLDTYLLYRIM